MLLRTKPVLLLAFIAAAGACEPIPTAHMPGVEKPEFTTYEAIQYPLHVYGDDTDGWDYLTSGTPVWVEIPADDQTPNSEDGYGKRRVCPNDQMIMKNAHLRMNYGLETLDLDFRGPFSFIRHVSTMEPAEGGSPYPTATYRFPQNAYSRDNKYYAPAGGEVLLACDGNYVVNNAVFRMWVGHLYGKLYNGDIVRNPDYDECGGSGGDGGGGGDLEEPMTMMSAPTETSLNTCSGGGGGGGDPGSTWRCYTVTIDHYWYYPDTGRIEYRYTEEYSWCEQIA